MAENISNIKSTGLQGLEGFADSAVVFTQDVDNAFWVHMYISIFLFAVVVGAMLYFAWKYRASNVKDEDIVEFKHHTGLEIAWTLIPTALLMVMFYYGYTSMKSLRTMPANEESMIVKLEGRKWQWTYTYPNGKVTKHLYAPANQNVILEMSAPANDVIHAWYVPAFRMKEDVVPGRVTKQWFNSSKTGKYVVECAEYCGTRHSDMYSEVHIMDRADFDAWYNSDKRTPYESDDAPKMTKGQELYENNGCNGCHSIADDSVLVGPSLKGIASTRDDAYLKDAIVNPDKDVPAGFSAGVMPAFALPDEDIAEIINYLKAN